MGMIETLIADNKYRSELTGGAITESTADACSTSDNILNHNALCAGELAYPETAATDFTT